MKLDLSEQERRQLIELVRNARADINPEIHHTMGAEYREQLRQRRTSLEGLLKRLGANVEITK
jgi:hypothetical protein